MEQLGFWDYLLLSIAAYVAVVALIRLMRRRRDEMVADLDQKIRAEQARQVAQRREQARQEARARQLQELTQRRHELNLQPARESPGKSAPQQPSDAAATKPSTDSAPT